MTQFDLSAIEARLVDAEQSNDVWEHYELAALLAHVRALREALKDHECGYEYGAWVCEACAVLAAATDGPPQ